MAKTESTAVNALIDNLQKGTALPLSATSEPGSDLFVEPPRMTTPPRMSSSSPSPHVAGDLAPLPRSRAPQSTQNLARPALPPPSARLSSAGITPPPPPNARLSSAGITPPPPPGARLSSAGITPPPPPGARLSSPGITPPPPPGARASSAGITPPPPPGARASSAGITPPAIRTSTAPPVRGNTIPSLPQVARTSSAEILPPPPVMSSPLADIEVPLADLESPLAHSDAMEASSSTSPTSATSATPSAAASSNERGVKTAIVPALPPPSRMPTSTRPPANLPVAAPFERRANADETWKGRRGTRRSLAKQLAIPAVLCIGAGVALGFYMSAQKHKTPVAPTPVAAQAQLAQAQLAPAPTDTALHPSAPAAESANAATASAGGLQPEPPTKEEQAATMAAAMTHDAPAPALGKPATLVDVRIDSQPAGVNITLVDGESRFPLGSTPLSTSLDPSRTYDVLVETRSHAVKTFHVDPSTTTHLDVSPDAKPAPMAKAEMPKAEMPKAEMPKAEVAKAEMPKAATPKAAAPKAMARTEHHAAAMVATSGETAAPASANGTLMVSAKPPCELLIDGASTGLRTPQRSIELAPGRHEITFVNAEQGIKKTVSVTVKAGAPTKLIQDLMK